MKTTTRLHPMRALRGLRTLALAAIAAATAIATTHTALAEKGFIGPINPIAADGSFTNNGWSFENVASEPDTTIPANLTYTVSPDRSTLTLVISSPAGVATSGLPLNSVLYRQSPRNLPEGFITYDWKVVFSEDVKEGQLGFLGSDYNSGSRDLEFQAGVVYSGQGAFQLSAYVGWTPTSDHVVTCTITFSNLTWGPNQIMFAKGDPVPGVPAAKFTGFGIPAIGFNGGFAMLGKWSSPVSRGSGIVVTNELLMNEVLIKVGDEIPGGSGVIVKSLKDPVVDASGYVAFPATLAGNGITAANDSAILSNAPGGTLQIVAQEGTQAPGAPTGALWKSFSSVAAPGAGKGVVIAGFMKQGTGGITAANDYGLWMSDETGELHLRIQEGTTTVGPNVVKSFVALNSVGGTQGQSHSFNTRGEVVAKLTYTNGVQALVKFFKPRVERSFKFHYSGAFYENTAKADGIMTVDTALFANPFSGFDFVGTGYAVTGLTMTISGASSGNGTFGTSDFLFYAYSIFDALDLDTEWVGQAQPSQGTVWGTPGSDGTAGDLGFYANSLDGPGSSDPFLLTTSGGEGDRMALTSMTPLPYDSTPVDKVVLFQKGDTVPGVPGATFTTFGTPAINNGSVVAFLGRWKSSAGAGVGIFSDGKLVAKVGDDLSGGAGTQILKSVTDPVINESNFVGFHAVLKGTGVTAANDRALVSNWGDGSAKVVTQEGAAAVGPAGGIFKSFDSLAMAGNGLGPMWLGTLAKGGAITAANKQGLWTAPSAESQQCLLQSGKVLDGKTVKSFQVLKAVSGTPGQTHAFNDFGGILAQVTFTDGSQAILHIFASAESAQ